jgi:flagellar biogenesis protein FliO
MASLLVRFIVGSGVVLGLLWCASQLTHRYGSARVGTLRRVGGLDVVARRQLSRGASIVRVSLDDKDLLLGCSAKGIEMLCELPLTRDEPAPEMLAGLSDTPVVPTFAGMLTKATGRWATSRSQRP